MANMKTSREAVIEWRQRFIIPPSHQEERAFEDGYNAAIYAMMDKILELNGESK